MQNKIKYYRLEKDLLLTELADIVGLSAGYISHLEKGTRNNPSYSVMLKISKALGESITELFIN